MIRVYPREGESIDHLIKRYRRIRCREGLKQELIKRESYMKPSDLRRAKHNAAVRRIKRNGK